MAPPKLNPVERFWSKVTKTETCWLWNTYRDPDGYGNFYYQGASQRAHRMAWIFTRGPIPEGKLICHKCDNPPCVRPDHLFLGSTEENVADKIKKGRILWGNNHYRSILTVEQAEEIRQRVSNGEKQRRLALEYRVSPQVINSIVKFKVFKTQAATSTS